MIQPGRDNLRVASTIPRTVASSTSPGALSRPAIASIAGYGSLTTCSAHRWAYNVAVLAGSRWGG